MLAVALASVALTVALPFKIWLGQRGDIASLTAQTRQAQQQVNQLTAQQKRWNDNAYVEQQARERLHYVMPGQKTYVVLGPPAHRRASRPVATPTDASTSPWYTQLWKSVQAAGGTDAARR